MIKVPEFFTSRDNDHDLTDPFDLVTWVKRDALILDYKHRKEDGSPGIAFEQRGVEFPDFYSQQAVNIVTSKYFRGKLGTPAREKSLKQVISRVTDWITAQGISQGYWDEGSTYPKIFNYELRHILLHQLATFNSPVWFNVGVIDRPQCSACFILKVEDHMESILDLGKLEGMIFKGGSGSGVSLGTLRASSESLALGGKSSGPVSFMKGLDAMAGAIKSGGTTRRAAKIVILPSHHLDVEKFIWCKAHEEKKAKLLKSNGYEIGLDSDEVFYQNANNSVRVDDEFMHAAVEGRKYTLRGIHDPITRDVEAKDLMRQIAQAAWECGDPGLQFDDTINSWHTTPFSGRQNATNPCGEFAYLDLTSCNLASINLIKFLRADKSFDIEGFCQVVDIFITAMDIIVEGSSYPDPRITENSHKHRPLGLGYSNLGSILMHKGFAYDSEEGRHYAAAITALMHGRAYRRSAELAEEIGPFAASEVTSEGRTNGDEIVKIIRRHRESTSSWKKYLDNYMLREGDSNLFAAADTALEQAVGLASQFGVRNSQVTLLAPTGTISFFMDCETTGIEPLFQLVTTKTLVGGGSMIVNFESVEKILEAEYTQAQAKEIADYFKRTHGRVSGAPHLKPQHYKLFDTAAGWINPETKEVEGSISWKAHVDMMASVQPFLSGAISKTVNLPESATVEDFMSAYIYSWKVGVKSLTLYRDNCKAVQPLTTTSTSTSTSTPSTSLASQSESSDRTYDGDVDVVKWPLPVERPSVTCKLNIGQDFEGYFTWGLYPDTNRPGELFMRGTKAGSTLAGLLDCFSIAVSIGLQYGVPLEKFIECFKGVEFEPKGFCGREGIRFCKSIPDFLFRWAEQRFLKGSLTQVDAVRLDFTPTKPTSVDRAPMPWEGEDEDDEGEDDSAGEAEAQGREDEEVDEENSHSWEKVDDLCPRCGSQMHRAGACMRCMGCGNQSGCG